MQNVIAGYESLEQAEQAVRSLESQLSIQDVVIADRHHVVWRQLHLTRDRSVRAHGDPNFLVVMIGDPNQVERARDLLHSKVTLPFEPHQLNQDELADLAGEDSFPASDPPCWTLGRDRPSGS